MKEVAFEAIKNPGLYEQRPQMDKKFVEDAIAFVLKKIDENLNTFVEKFPAPASKNQVYEAIDNVDWTASFWTGMVWLAYELTGDKKYRDLAEVHERSFKKRMDEKIAVDHHDLGFLYSLSSVANYKLTGNKEAAQTALNAAKQLTTRYVDAAGIIQAWGSMTDPNQRGRMIIDCNMNLPLLYWTAQMTGDESYYKMAYSHVKQAEKYIIREDASTFHTYFMDTETGAPRFGKTAQGYSDDSCWARGQAWGIYGFPLSYIYTGDEGLLDTTKKLANYFINRLPEDQVCYWDLIFTAGNEERDSSAAAIAACGLLEIAKHLPLTDTYRTLYENAALQMIKALAENYTTVSRPDSNGVLLHAVYSKPGNAGVDECCIWGDYFYLEALVRILKDWKLYW